MNDSYSATRIHVMKTKLIQKNEYERLLKMSDNEVIHFLQNTDYKEDIDAIIPKHIDNIESVDRIIHSNSLRTYNKLKRISSDNFTTALNKILADNDRWNLQVIAEALAGQEDTKASLENYKKVGTFDAVKFTDVKTIKELSEKTKKILGFDKTPETLIEFLDALDTGNSYEGIKSGALLTDEKNILTILRCKRQEVSKERIKRMLERGGRISIKKLMQAAEAKDMKSSLEILKNTPYAEVIEQTLSNWQESNILHFEDKLHKSILDKITRLTRAKPLGVDMLLNFVTEKELEYSNIRLLLKGKRLGLDESFIREKLVT